MSRPIRAVIHQAALRHNLIVARKMTPHSQIFAVVKANAYGHGVERVYEALQQADGFALLDIAEAKRLRALGWQGKILLLEGLFDAQDLHDCIELDLSFTVHSPYQINWLQQFKGSAQFNIFLKMNTGMNRLGFDAAAYRMAWHSLNQLASVKSIVHMTHFSDADGERLGESGIAYQQQVFEESITGLSGQSSISNSAAILRHSQHLHSDYVRSGIMLYGSSPDYPTHSSDDWQLQPSMSLRSKIIAVQEVKASESIGYGSHFIASEPLKIGIVACGYADGYQRISKTGTPVLVNSTRTQILGRVSMDMLAVDLTHIHDADIGSEVVLWGKSVTGAILSIDEVAAGSDTVGYELMCAVTARVQFEIEA